MTNQKWFVISHLIIVSGFWVRVFPQVFRPAKFLKLGRRAVVKIEEAVGLVLRVIVEDFLIARLAQIMGADDGCIVRPGGFDIENRFFVEIGFVGFVME